MAMEGGDQGQRGQRPDPRNAATALQVLLPTQLPGLGVQLAFNLPYQLLTVTDELPGRGIQCADIGQALA